MDTIFSDEQQINELAARIRPLLQSHQAPGRARTSDGVYLDNEQDVLWLVAMPNGWRLQWSEDRPSNHSVVASWPEASKRRPSMEEHCLAIALDLVDNRVQLPLAA